MGRAIIAISPATAPPQPCSSTARAKTKSPATTLRGFRAGRSVGPALASPVSEGLDLGGLLALLAHGLDVAHLLAFLQRLEARAFDGGEVREQVIAAFVRRDEAEALGVVEPLNGTGFHIYLNLEFQNERKRSLYTVRNAPWELFMFPRQCIPYDFDMSLS